MSRRASASGIWEMLMMTGMLSRKCSAMTWTSLNARGCTVRISLISLVGREGARRIGVTEARAGAAAGAGAAERDGGCSAS